MRACIGEFGLDAVANALVDNRCDADAARFGQRLQPCGNIDAIAIRC
jgi:hypothetical protein